MDLQCEKTPVGNASLLCHAVDATEVRVQHPTHHLQKANLSLHFTSAPRLKVSIEGSCVAYMLANQFLALPKKELLWPSCSISASCLMLVQTFTGRRRSNCPYNSSKARKPREWKRQWADDIHTIPFAEFGAKLSSFFSVNSTEPQMLDQWGRGCQSIDQNEPSYIELENNATWLPASKSLIKRDEM